MLEKNEGNFDFSIHFHLATHVRSFAPDCPHKETDSEKNEGQDSYGEYFQLHTIPPNLITGHPGESFPAKPQICEGKVINHYEFSIHICALPTRHVENSLLVIANIPPVVIFKQACWMMKKVRKKRTEYESEKCDPLVAAMTQSGKLHLTDLLQLSNEQI